MEAQNDLETQFARWREAWISLERMAHRLSSRVALVRLSAKLLISEEEYEDFERLDRRQMALMGELMQAQREALQRRPPVPPDSSDSSSLAVSVLEAAKILGVSRSSVYEAVRQGQIPSIHIGKRILISQRALENMFNMPE